MLLKQQAALVSAAKRIGEFFSAKFIAHHASATSFVP
jgi:hypothetical protein